MANALLQSAKQIGYMNGKHLGEGPSLEKLIDRVGKGQTASPPQVAKVMQDAVSGTPMYDMPQPLYGDKESVQRKRGRLSSIEEGSHRPGYTMASRFRPMRGAARKVSYKDNSSTMHGEGEDRTMQIVEQPMSRTMWAIRRTPINSRLKCLGLVDGKTKCNAYIQSSSVGVVAPSFYSERRHPGPGGPKPQFMWFCPSDVSHTWHVDHNIIYHPEFVGKWKVELGTNITSVEIQGLLNAGFDLQMQTTSVVLGESSKTPTAEKSTIEEGIPDVAKSRSTKWRHGVSKEAEKRITNAENMTAIVIEESVMEPLKHSIFQVSTENEDVYFVHLKAQPWCSCPDFMKREVASKPYIACKHLYFVFIRVLGLDKNKDMIIHQPTISSLEISKILSCPRNSSVSL